MTSYAVTTKNKSGLIIQLGDHIETNLQDNIVFQVSTMEQTLQKVSSSHQRELEMMSEKLQSTMEQLEQTKIHRQQLNDQVTTINT